jgi:uncharacterized SAM-binding protein YcdF (DUF218 family)
MLMEMQDVVKFLINPLLYVLAGLVVLVLVKEHRVQMAALIAVYFYLISIAGTGHFFSKLWKIDDTFKQGITYDSVIVLAGVSDARWQIHREGIPYIPGDFFATSDNSDKILAGIYFVKTDHAKLLLIGEFIDGSYNEGKAVKKLALDMGLKEYQIRIYGRVNRTLDEVEVVKPYLEAHSLKENLLISSEPDMRRALAMFRKEGVNPDVFSVDKEPDEIDFNSFIPTTTGIAKTHRFIYEVAGYVGYYLKGKA